jgi:electron transport complex protein RnfC
MEGRPLISRYVTVTGDGVREPQVLEAPIGMLIGDLVEQCGGYTDSVRRLIMGGPMMGFALSRDDVPIVKGTNCILVTSEALAPATHPAMPCIRCGACADVCPVNLLPQQLYWHARAKELDKAQDYNLFDCIECGCCAAVCPSHIPLIQYYRFAKTEIWAQERERRKADLARQRHEFRLERLQREKEERAARLRQKKEAVAPTPAAEDTRKAAIAAALARTKAKKAATGEAPPDQNPPRSGQTDSRGSQALAEPPNRSG